MIPRPATRRPRWATRIPLGVRVLLPLLALALAPAPGAAAKPARPRSRPPAPPAQPPAERVELGRYFPDSSGTFVLLDGRTGRRQRYNAAQAARRFIPASTFKIPNTLIALDTGVADGPDFALAWDPVRVPQEDWWPKSWARDHRLRTALRDSVFWYYQELARRIGPARMREHVRRFRYGNMDLAGGVDRFWLHGGLRISADEQVDFLRRAYRGELGVSERSTAVLKEILVLEDVPAYRLSGKSGTGETGSGGTGRQVGWHVGWVEREGEVWFYALNLLHPRVWEDWPPARRLDLVREILRELAVLPAPARGRSGAQAPARGPRRAGRLPREGSRPGSSRACRAGALRALPSRLSTPSPGGSARNPFITDR